MIAHDKLNAIISNYKMDKESVYNTWFTNNEDRLKAFRVIRRGVEQVVQDIKSNTFGADFKGSSLEVVLSSITEQKQVFEGAAHPFYWKPKLRIPDIYENDINKSFFGQFLESCLLANSEDQIIREIVNLSKREIKGLGPSVANILYFIHPTITPPFNTAILKGYNLLFQENKKLGSWESYLEMRDRILQINQEFKNVLSNDLGAISGLLFDIGVGKIIIDENIDLVIEKERKKNEQVQRKRHEEVKAEIEEGETHTKIQYLLTKMGRSLGYDVIVASNDRGKSFNDEKFSFLCLSDLPALDADKEILRTIDLIDVIWFEKGTSRILCAFEVEKSTSIYSGILRLADLALTLSRKDIMICLVAPDEREKEIIAQLKRPSLGMGHDLNISYIVFSDICTYCDSICKLGNDYHVLEKIAKRGSGN